MKHNSFWANFPFFSRTGAGFGVGCVWGGGGGGAKANALA